MLLIAPSSLDFIGARAIQGRNCKGYRTLLIWNTKVGERSLLRSLRTLESPSAEHTVAHLLEGCCPGSGHPEPSQETVQCCISSSYMLLLHLMRMLQQKEADG